MPGLSVSPMNLSDYDLHLFREGTHERLWERLGAHPASGGARFLVWAPHADEVAVACESDQWMPHALARADGGVWGGFIPGVSPGARYKYRIAAGGREVWKADPFAFRAELPPGTASVVWNLDFEWHDGEWMTQRHRPVDEPMSIYEVHLGSWRHGPDERGGGRPLGYREIAPALAVHAREGGFTHVEFLPVMEHPFGGSWGYQPLGFFAATSRYGTPQDLMFLIDVLHREGIGVILDWVPSHFAGDAHGLAEFDGLPLYESGHEAQWGGHAFDYTKPEVRSFLRSSAAFWLEQYHADGFRIDAVASIRARAGGEAFLRRLNAALRVRFPETVLVAEDSSPETGLTAPVDQGGLGFDFRWDMGWMHDSLAYLTRPLAERPSRHGRLTFRPLYLWNERWILPLSHDEVKPPFGSLVTKMAGNPHQQFANVRLLLAWMYAQPGAKLLFMGGEFAELQDWRHDRSLDWRLLESAQHAGVRNLVWFLNRAYRAESALHENETSARCFEWIDCCDEAHSSLSFLRRGRSDDHTLLAVFNFSPVEHTQYRVGVPFGSAWREILCTDAAQFGGDARSRAERAPVEPVPWQHQSQSIRVSVPALSALWLKPVE